MTGSYAASMRSALGLVLLVAVGCGGSAYEYSSADTAPSGGAAVGGAAPAAPADYGSTTGAAEVQEMLAMEADDAGGFGGGGGDFDEWENVPEEEPAPVARQEQARTETTQAQYAQNQADGGDSRSTTGGQQQTTPGQQGEATDAVDLSQPLLIYTADLHLGVYEVEATQETILGAVNELGGHLAQRSDMIIVVRVPSQRFQQALDAIEEAGDVIHRNIEVLDVSEEYRDLAIRIRNAEAMRERLEQLLRQANNVQEALAVERELQRITESIERMKGRLRFLSDRIAFSTITVRFQALGDSMPIQEDRFRLPFPWLEELGLPNLLSL